MNTILYFRPGRTPNSADKLTGVLEIAKKAHVHVQAIEDPPTARLVRELREFWNPVGVIVECGARTATIDSAAFGGSPVIFFNHSFTELPPECFAVRHDSVSTGKLAARELLRSGGENFAFIRAPRNPFWCREREHGFREALALNGKTPRIFRSAGSATATARNQMLRDFLARLPRPCEVFAANDETAAETMAAAKMLGLSIPQDLSILGVDDIPSICEHTEPTLSSIQPDFRTGGSIAMLMLLAVIHDGKDFRGPRQRTFGDLRIERRLSTKRLPHPDASVSNALDLIRRKACAGLTAAEVAGRFPCSRRMADKRFRKATGHSILDEIQSVRLERAKLLLMNPNQQLKSISDFCGLRTPNALRKFFRKETGMTLSAWRKTASPE